MHHRHVAHATRHTLAHTHTRTHNRGTPRSTHVAVAVGERRGGEYSRQCAIIEISTGALSRLAH